MAPCAPAPQQARRTQNGERRSTACTRAAAGAPPPAGLVRLGLLEVVGGGPQPALQVVVALCRGPDPPQPARRALPRPPTKPRGDQGHFFCSAVYICRVDCELTLFVTPSPITTAIATRLSSPMYSAVSAKVVCALMAPCTPNADERHCFRTKPAFPCGAAAVALTATSAPSAQPIEYEVLYQTPAIAMRCADPGGSVRCH